MEYSSELRIMASLKDCAADSISLEQKFFIVCKAIINDVNALEANLRNACIAKQLVTN